MTVAERREITFPTKVVNYFEGITDEVISQDESLRWVTLRKPLPMQLVWAYVRSATSHANVRKLPDGTWFAEIEGFPGVWANESNPQELFDVLHEVIFEWVLLKIRDEDRDLPVLESLDLNTL